MNSTKLRVRHTLDILTITFALTELTAGSLVILAYVHSFFIFVCVKYFK